MSLPKDDLVRILKEVCSSSRYLLENAKANNLKAPYQVTKGKVLKLQCSAQADPPTTPPPSPNTNLPPPSRNYYGYIVVCLL